MLDTHWDPIHSHFDCYVTTWNARRWVSPPATPPCPPHMYPQPLHPPPQPPWFPYTFLSLIICQEASATKLPRHPSQWGSVSNLHLLMHQCSDYITDKWTYDGFSWPLINPVCNCYLYLSIKYGIYNYHSSNSFVALFGNKPQTKKEITCFWGPLLCMAIWVFIPLGVFFSLFIYIFFFPAHHMLTTSGWTLGFLFGHSHSSHPLAFFAFCVY